MYKKNAAVTGFPFALFNAADGSAITSGTVNGYYTLDGGGQGSITDTPVHEGNGQWSVDLAAGEMNGDIVGVLFTHEDAVPVHFTIKTETTILSDGVALAADGLDAIPVTAPAGVAADFREMIVAIFRRFFGKATMTATEIKTYAENGTDVLTTQAISDNGTTQTQGEAG